MGKAAIGSDPQTGHPSTGEAASTSTGEDSSARISITDAGNETSGTEVDELAERVQDVLVPWVYQPKPLPSEKKPKEKGRKRTQIPNQSPASNLKSQPNHLETGNTTETSATPEPAEPIPDAVPAQPEAQVFHRYYHLFVRGDLRGLVERAAVEGGYVVLPDLGQDGITAQEGEVDVGGKKWVRIREVGWEADNWWIEGEVGRG